MANDKRWEHLESSDEEAPQLHQSQATSTAARIRRKNAHSSEKELLMFYEDAFARVEVLLGDFIIKAEELHQDHATEHSTTEADLIRRFCGKFNDFLKDVEIPKPYSATCAAAHSDK